ncbi:MAG: hypothetical protein VX583_04985 [Bdellovibrionota bacterium]
MSERRVKASIFVVCSFLMLMYQNCDYHNASQEICPSTDCNALAAPEPLKIDWETTMKARLIFSNSKEFPKIIETTEIDFLSNSVVQNISANQELYINIAHLTEHSKVCIYDLSDDINNHCLKNNGELQLKNFYSLRESKNIHSIPWNFEQRLETTYVEEQPYVVDFPSWQGKYDIQLGEEKVIFFYELSSRESYGPYSFKVTAPEFDIIFRDERDVAGSSKEFESNAVLINFTENFSEQIYVCEIILLKDESLNDESYCKDINNYQALDTSLSESIIEREDIRHNHLSWAEELSKYGLKAGDRIYRYYIDKNWFPGYFSSDSADKTFLKKEILIT